jgi:hypothetical protein
MALEQLITPEIIVPLAIFSMPVAILWIKKHYAALEKGLVKPLGAAEDSQRIAALEKRNLDLLQRVENLESIIVALDTSPPQPRLAATREK